MSLGYDLLEIDDDGAPRWIGAYPNMARVRERLHNARRKHIIYNATTRDQLIYEPPKEAA